MPDVVYVLTNEAMPGLVKIGVTTDSVESRIAQISVATGVPLPFECYFAAEVPNAPHTESVLHELFSDGLVNPWRDFFRVDPEKVVLAIGLGEFTEVTPGISEIEPIEMQALERVRARRPRLRLDAIGIMPGDALKLSRDESITATVVEDGKVEFRGAVMSISAAALSALHSLGYRTPEASGSEYWMFEDELLDERRRRIESQQFDEPGVDE